MKKILLLFVVILCCYNVTKAQSNPELLIDSFFVLYKNVGIEKAIDFVFATNKYMEQSKEVIDNIKLRLSRATPLLGPYQGYDLFIKKQAGQSYAYLSYLIKYDRQPIQISFILYKPKDKWQIQNLRFDDKVDDELEKLPNVAK
jgi:hypothetical protein